jgi:DNA-binding MarR family transcriptional regulator
VSNGNVTGIVDRLVEDGLVVRVPVEGDRRAMLVRLTRKGRERIRRNGEGARRLGR